MVKPLQMVAPGGRIVKISLVLLDGMASIAVETRNRQGDLLHLFEDKSDIGLEAFDAIVALARARRL